MLYLFRGHEREWVNPAEDMSRGNRNVIDVYEELVAAGAIGPMVLVFPGISSNDNVYSGMLVNMIDPEKTHGARGVGSGRFEDYFLQDLIPFINANYPVLPGAAHRGVDGFSLGGFMAVKIATQHPDWFATVGAYDGLFLLRRRDFQRGDLHPGGDPDRAAVQPAGHQRHDERAPGHQPG
ncbi:alpha/beta hydrolase-fold protein [Candidatus Amarolinea dominans]|uniref:alpha/beta hydrolase n=1 Tax=Candidatus Amarolinea dominans TaxID=3140696 RepID=UPI0031353E69|nr:hypothetical protein [Anaerolineae bacterium]